MLDTVATSEAKHKVEQIRRNNQKKEWQFYNILIDLDPDSMGVIL